MQIEATGKSVEIAIQNGLLECGMKREDVNIKVVETGGLFKKAKVILSWGESQEKQEEVVESHLAEEQISEEKEQEEIVEEKPVEPVKKQKKLVDTNRLAEKCVEFMTGIAKMFDENATVEATQGENEVAVSVKGENLGKLIGFHGETLNAFKLLLTGLKSKGEGAVRISLDINGYVADKNADIVALANKTAEQAIKIERNIHLDPMSAYDRRIVHLTLQDRDDVTTESTGEGEKRHVVVKPIFKK